MSFYKNLWAGWKRIARRIGDFQARLILALFYFIILSPFSLLVRISDPLGIRKRHSGKGWLIKAPDSRERMQRALQQS
jgi:hypothetical protein